MALTRFTFQNNLRERQRDKERESDKYWDIPARILILGPSFPASWGSSAGTGSEVGTEQPRLKQYSEREYRCPGWWLNLLWPQCPPCLHLQRRRIEMHWERREIFHPLIPSLIGCKGHGGSKLKKETTTPFECPVRVAETQVLLLLLSHAHYPGAAWETGNQDLNLHSDMGWWHRKLQFMPLHHMSTLLVNLLMRKFLMRPDMVFL